MRQGSGNTHLVTYATLDRLQEPPGSGHYVVSATAHAIVAVRRDDGDIVYIDPQDVPPAVYRALPMAAYHIAVFSTDVDWRFNRQLYAAVRDGAVHDSF